jgi:hypothetical protein
MSSLRDALSVWTLSFGAASAEFIAKLAVRFPDWSCLKEFCTCLPESQLTLEVGERTYGWLWPESWISGCMDDNGSSRYLTVGSLADGSTLALDTQDQEDPFRIGTFSLELCGEDNWSVLEPSRYRAFPFSYPSYLEYLRGEPEIKYLVG